MTAPDYKNLPEERLVELIKQNDSLAFKQLYLRYYEQLYRFAYFRLYAVETTKDILQELFSRVWNKKSNLDPSQSIKAYLYRALTNLIINHANLESSKNSSLTELNENTANTNEGIDEQIDLRNAINELPEKLKSVYLLSRVEGYKYAEIAEILDLSVKAVEKRMSKALNLLRKRFN